LRRQCFKFAQHSFEKCTYPIQSMCNKVVGATHISPILTRGLDASGGNLVADACPAGMTTTSENHYSAISLECLPAILLVCRRLCITGRLRFRSWAVRDALTFEGSPGDRRIAEGPRKPLGGFVRNQSSWKGVKKGTPHKTGIAGRMVKTLFQATCGFGIAPGLLRRIQLAW